MSPYPIIVATKKPQGNISRKETLNTYRLVMIIEQWHVLQTLKDCCYFGRHKRMQPNNDSIGLNIPHKSDFIFYSPFESAIPFFFRVESRTPIE